MASSLSGSGTISSIEFEAILRRFETALNESNAASKTLIQAADAEEKKHNAERDEQDRKVSSLENLVNTLREQVASIDKTRAQMISENKESKVQIDAVVAERDLLKKRVTHLNTQKEAATTSHNAQMAAATARHSKELSDAKTKHDKESKEARDGFQDVLSGMRKELAQANQTLSNLRARTRHVGANLDSPIVVQFENYLEQRKIAGQELKAQNGFEIMANSAINFWKLKREKWKKFVNPNASILRIGSQDGRASAPNEFELEGLEKDVVILETADVNARAAIASAEGSRSRRKKALTDQIEALKNMMECQQKLLDTASASLRESHNKEGEFQQLLNDVKSHETDHKDLRKRHDIWVKLFKHQ